MCNQKASIMRSIHIQLSIAHSNRTAISSLLLWGITLCCLTLPLNSQAASDQQKIDFILKMDTPPFGVVFEIVEGDANALNWAIPQITQFSKQLRDKFPKIGIAVVSHGSEQFALMKTKQKQHGTLHKNVKSLLAQDIPVHVCGTHASWKNKSAADFPDYVDVTPAGPTAISNYEDMGYELVVINGP